MQVDKPKLESQKRTLIELIRIIFISESDKAYWDFVYKVQRMSKLQKTRVAPQEIETIIHSFERFALGDIRHNRRVIFLFREIKTC